MKNKILLLSFTILSTLKGFGQAPVLGPIQGNSTVCSSPGSANNYAVSASNNPNSYLWSVQPSFGVILSSPNSSATSISFPQGIGNYTVTCVASNGNGFSAPVTKIISVFQTPIITFSGNNSFCQGSSTNIQASSTLLMASPTISYNWSPPTGLNTTSGSFVNASPNSNTTYTVTGTVGLCSNTATTNIIVLPLPIINISSSNPLVCSGSTATLTVSGTAVSYSLNSIPAPQTFVISPISSTQYNFSGTGLNGCINTGSFIQNVSSCVGINEQSAILVRNLSLYPNPNNGSFMFTAGISGKLKIVNCLGATIKCVDVQAEQKVNVTGLSTGIYFANFEGKTLKFIVE